MNTCTDCGGEMKLLFGHRMFCADECDLAPRGAGSVGDLVKRGSNEVTNLAIPSRSFGGAIIGRAQCKNPASYSDIDTRVGSPDRGKPYGATPANAVGLRFWLRASDDLTIINKNLQNGRRLWLSQVPKWGISKMVVVQEVKIKGNYEYVPTLVRIKKLKGEPILVSWK